MIAGINITGYQVTQLRDQKNTSAWTVANINNKMIELFGSGGVSAGGSFLKKVTLGNEVRFIIHQYTLLYSLKIMLANMCSMLLTWKSSEILIDWQ